MRERRENIVSECLEVFIRHGLSGATNRVICRELGMVQSNIYTYFNTRDEMVIACSKLAMKRLSDNVFIPTVKDMVGNTLDYDTVVKRVNEMIPTMSFMLQVYIEEKYKPQLIDITQKESKLYREIVKEKGISDDKINKKIILLITAVTNFMIFSDEAFLRPLLDMVIDGMQ